MVIIFTIFTLIVAAIIAGLLLSKTENDEPNVTGDLPLSSPATNSTDSEALQEETFTFRGATFEGAEEINRGIRQFVTETIPENGLNTTHFPTTRDNYSPDEAKELPTEEEIFAFVNPPEVVTALKAQQEDMIKRGILSEEKRSNFDSNADIIDYFANIAEVYIQYAPLTPAEEMRIREIAVDDLPKIMEYEREKYLLMRSRAFNPFLDALYTIDEYFQQESILEEFFSLLVPSAYATWETTTDCYKDDSDTGSGYNGSSFCCNCGLYCSSGCSYVSDCGEQATECNVQLGCLNSVCQLYGSAIWDSTSFICGCG